MVGNSNPVMQSVKVASLGQASGARYEVGGFHRRIPAGVSAGSAFVSP